MVKLEPTLDSTESKTETKLVRVLSPDEKKEFERNANNLIKRLRPPGAVVRCPYTDCRKAFNYAIKTRGWLQQEGEDIGSNTATKVSVFHCRRCDRDFNDLTPIGPAHDSPTKTLVIPPPGPERMEFLRKLFGEDKKEGGDK
jgi:hypothetical protein